MWSLACLALLAPSTHWTLVAGGDVMLHGIKPGTRPLAGVAKEFREADVAYANIEVPLTNATTRTPHKSADDLRARRQFILKADPKHLHSLVGIGLDLVSLGNNHAMDYGPQGLAEMILLLERNGINHAGAGMNDQLATSMPVLHPRPGVRLGLLSHLSFRSTQGRAACWPATGDQPGVATLTWKGPGSQADLRALVDNYKVGHSVLVLALHWGIENESLPNAYQVGFARALIDAGTDAVLGTHPHVLQGSEIYKGKPIVYSLGNLVSPLPGSTAVYTLTFEGTKFKSFAARPARISGGKVTFLEGEAARRASQRIGQLDAAIQRAYPVRQRAK